MAWERWTNGNQVTYGASGWYRFVIDRDIDGGTISIRWGVETNYSLSDGNNYAKTGCTRGDVYYTNTSFSHSGAAVTWIRSATYYLNYGESVSVNGYVQGLSEGSGGGAQSATPTYTYTRPAIAPNQMSAPSISNLSGVAHTVSWTPPGTNGADITGYHLEWQTQAGAAVATADVGPTTSAYNASGFSPNTAYRVRVYATSSAGDSVVSAWTNFTTPVAAPAAPSAPTVTRTSDTSHSLAWALGPQTAGPYASQDVLRRTRTNGVWGAYVVVAATSATATTYADTTTTPNAAYEYQIRATNVSGSTASGASGTVWTTPGVPTGQSASKDASGNIVVSWAAPSNAANAADLKYEVSESTDGGSTWAVLSTTAAGVLSYSHASPNTALPHTYRIRAIVSPVGLVGSGLASGYVVTNTVQLLTAPATPTNLASSPAGTANRAQPITLSWAHNPLDSTPQTKFTLQHRAVGASSWTTVGPITSSVSSYTMPGGTYATGAGFEWRVLTYGLHASPSPYSAVSTVQLSSAPGVSISSPTPGQVVASTSLTVSWAFSDPDGDPQGSWEATLSENGVPVETKTGANTDASTTFTYRLLELAYTVQVRVRDSRGLWSTPDTVAFTVNYPEPPAPVISGTAWNWRTGTISLDISVPAPSGGEVAVEHLEVWRSINDGPWALLVTGLPPGTLSYQDTSPTVSGKNMYVVQAVSDLPSSAQSTPADVITPQAEDGRPGVWLSAGPGFSVVGCLRSEVEIETARIRERVLRRYAGMKYPRSHEGEHVDETWQVSGNLNLRWSKAPDPPGAPEAWAALGEAEGPFLLRAPDLFGGGAIYAYVNVEGPTVSRQRGGNAHRVAFTATRVDG